MGGRAKKRAARQRQATLRRLAGTAWRYAGLEAAATEEIVETLAGLGIHTDEARFRELAVASGDVEALAEA